MRILVTGAAGFIGSHLCENLLQQNHEVVGLDNFVSGSSKNIQTIQHQPGFTLLRHDVTTPLTDEIGDIQQIYHLASPSSASDFQEIPLQTLWANAAGTKLMLELAQKKGSAFLLASASAVYGDPAPGTPPVQESYFGNVSTVGKQSCYTEGKRFAEALAINYYRHYRFPLQMVRIFDTYGPRMRKHDGGLISGIVQSALMGEPIRMQGDGSKQYSFCFVDDVVDGIIATMNTPDFLGPINMGSDEKISERALVKAILELTHSSSMVLDGASNSENEHPVYPDLTLAKNRLSFQPKIGFDEGIQKTIEYFMA